jgi:hypothetical protein
MSAEPPTIDGERFKSVTTLVGLSGAAGLILYFFTWSAVDAFYILFGIQPEEAGANQALLLSRATTWAISNIFFWLLILVVVVLILINLPARRPPLHMMRHLLPPRSRQRRMAQLVIALVLLLLGFATYIRLTSIGYDCANLVMEVGASAARTTNNRCKDLYTVGVHISDVDVVWLSKPPEGWHQDDKLVFLGQSDGTITLYDITNTVLLRVPESTTELTHHFLVTG